MRQPDINEYLLRISGSAAIVGQLNADTRIRIKDGELEIYSVEKLDKQDGTFDIKYKARFVSAIELEQTGKKIFGKDKQRRSQKLRQAIFALQSDRGIEVDSDEFYDSFMARMTFHLNDIYDWIKNKEVL